MNKIFILTYWLCLLYLGFRFGIDVSIAIYLTFFAQNTIRNNRKENK